MRSKRIAIWEALIHAEGAQIVFLLEVKARGIDEKGGDKYMNRRKECLMGVT